MIEKAVILAGGLGKRMQEPAPSALDAPTNELASKGLKSFIPIGGRPFLDYSIGTLMEAGYTKICLVLGMHSRPIETYYLGKQDSLKQRGVALAFAYQREPLGTADALQAAAAFVGSDEFCMINGDNLYPVHDLKRLREAPSGSCYMIGYDKNALVANSNIPAERIARFAVVVCTDGLLQNIIEKPEHAEQYQQVSMNCFRFTPAIIAACARIQPHPVRGEYELPSAVSFLLEKGMLCKVLPSYESVLDLTGRGDIEAVRELLGGRKLTW